MSAMEGAPDEAIEAGLREWMLGAGWDDDDIKANVDDVKACRREVEHILTAAQPSLHAAWSAPLLALVDEFENFEWQEVCYDDRDKGYAHGYETALAEVARQLDAALSAPVQAAETETEPVVTVRMLHRSPNHAKGQLGTLHDASPSGHRTERLKWVDYGEPIQWSHGQSESTGEWCGPGEYEVVPAAEDDECASCGEVAGPDCEKSQRSCGHHCNHSWEQDVCHWCGVTFGEDDVEIPAVQAAQSVRQVAPEVGATVRACDNYLPPGTCRTVLDRVPDRVGWCGPCVQAAEPCQRIEEEVPGEGPSCCVHNMPWNECPHRRPVQAADQRCSRCAGLDGAHGLVHVRHGNGAGHNEPCSLTQPAQAAEPHDFQLRTDDGVSTRCARCDLWVGKWDGSSPCAARAAEEVGGE